MPVETQIFLIEFEPVGSDSAGLGADLDLGPEAEVEVDHEFEQKRNHSCSFSESLTLQAQVHPVQVHPVCTLQHLPAAVSRHPLWFPSMEAVDSAASLGWQLVSVLQRWSTCSGTPVVDPVFLWVSYLPSLTDLCEAS